MILQSLVITGWILALCGSFILGAVFGWWMCLMYTKRVMTAHIMEKAKDFGPDDLAEIGAFYKMLKEKQAPSGFGAGIADPTRNTEI